MNLFNEKSSTFSFRFLQANAFVLFFEVCWSQDLQTNRLKMHSKHSNTEYMFVKNRDASFGDTAIKQVQECNHHISAVRDRGNHLNDKISPSEAEQCMKIHENLLRNKEHWTAKTSLSCYIFVIRLTITWEMKRHNNECWKYNGLRIWATMKFIVKIGTRMLLYLTSEEDTVIAVYTSIWRISRPHDLAQNSELGLYLPYRAPRPTYGRL